MFDDGLHSTQRVRLLSHSLRWHMVCWVSKFVRVRVVVCQSCASPKFMCRASHGVHTYFIVTRMTDPTSNALLSGDDHLVNRNEFYISDGGGLGSVDSSNEWASSMMFIALGGQVAADGQQHPGVIGD